MPTQQILANPFALQALTAIILALAAGLFMNQIGAGAMKTLLFILLVFAGLFLLLAR